MLTSTRLFNRFIYRHERKHKNVSERQINREIYPFYIDLLFQLLALQRNGHEYGQTIYS